MSSPFDSEHMKAAKKLEQNSGEMSGYYKEWKDSIQDESVFDDKMRELIGLAAAASTQCQYCVHTHGQKALKHGATEEEVAHVIQIAAQVRAGATMSYGLEALEHSGE
ncbi:MAG: carboxymuconolactone decarboxylase family protein [Candidatus Aenigmatarchaeota archaeon]